MFREFAFLAALALAAALGPATAQAEAEPELTNAEKPALDQLEPAMVFELAVREGGLDALVEPMAEAMLAVGEPVEGWSTTGLDYDGLMKGFAAENGSAFYLEEGEMGLFVSAFGELEPLLDEGFARHSLMQGEAAGTIETGMFQLFPDIWLEFVTGTRMIEKARCSGGIARVDLLTRRPMSQWADEELGMVALMYSLLGRFAEADICTTHSRDEDGFLLTTAYDSAARALTALNEDSEKGRIATREEVLALIASSPASTPDGE